MLTYIHTRTQILMYGQLDVHLVEGIDLPRMDFFGLCDPYVKISVDGFTITSEVCVYVCMYVCMYVCVCVFMYFV
jgi:hypothetical protein